MSPREASRPPARQPALRPWSVEAPPLATPGATPRGAGARAYRRSPPATRGDAPRRRSGASQSPRHPRGATEVRRGAPRRGWPRSRGPTTADSSSLHLRLVDQALKLVQLLVGHLRRGHVEERRDGLRCRAVEERAKYLPQRRLPRGVARDGGQIHIARAVVLETEVAFLEQYAQESPHSGIRGRIGERFHHLGGR